MVQGCSASGLQGFRASVVVICKVYGLGSFVSPVLFLNGCVEEVKKDTVRVNA